MSPDPDSTAATQGEPSTTTSAESTSETQPPKLVDPTIESDPATSKNGGALTADDFLVLPNEPGGVQAGLVWNPLSWGSKHSKDVDWPPAPPGVKQVITLSEDFKKETGISEYYLYTQPHSPMDIYILWFKAEGGGPLGRTYKFTNAGGDTDTKTCLEKDGDHMINWRNATKGNIVKIEW
jgi:hypothetical protein